MGAFIDSLTPDQKLLVVRRSRNAKRPTYFDPALAGAQAQAQATGNNDPNALDPNVQISEDLEAVFILLPLPLKNGLLSYLTTMLSLLGSADELELMTEILGIRTGTINQTVTDISAPIAQYDEVRESIMTFLTKSQTATAAPGQAQSLDQTTQTSADVVIPDLSILFGLTASGHSRIATTDLVEVHNRIADVGVVSAYSSDGLYRTQEITSWLGVITTYLS